METEQHQDNSSNKKRSRNYFSIATIFLVAMALFWSVDSSFVYIFLGAACFFLFLGFYTNPAPTPKDPYREYKKTYQQAKKVDATTSWLVEDLKNIFQQKSTFAGNRGFAFPGNAQKIVRGVALSIFFIGFIRIIASIFNSAGGSYDAASYYGMAEQHYLAQEYDSAYMNYRRAMQLEPEYEEAMLGYGNVLLVRNERDSAIMMFDKALAINPDYKEASYNKALTFYNQKKYNDGIALLSPLIEKNPEYYDAMLLLGDCYYTQSKYDEAIPWYENAYQNGGMRSRILCHIMAYIYDTKGEFERAIALYQEALSYDSSVVDIYQRLGELIPDESGNFYRVKAVQMSQ